MKKLLIIGGLLTGLVAGEMRSNIKKKSESVDNWAVGKLKKWIHEAEIVLKDPKSSEEQKLAAMKDIDGFTSILTKVGVEVD